MKNFFTQILNRIQKLDSYTTEYLKLSSNIEIPSLAYTNWGMHLAQIKDFNAAIEKLETAILMSNQNPKPCISLGIIYAKLKEYQKAENVLRKAIERDSQNPYTYSVLSSILVALDRYDEAEEMLKKALKLAPSDSEIYINYGVLYAKLQKKEKAIEMLKKAKFYNPTNLHSYFLLGVLLFETDKINEAFSEFKQLEEQKSDYKNLKYYLALCYKKEKNYIAVLEYAQQALEENPNSPSIYILLAQNYIDLNRNKEGFKIFEKGEENGIDDFEFYLSWGISLLQAGEYEQAKEKINISLQKNNKDSNALYRLGSCYYKEKNYCEAEKYFKTAIEENPKNSLAVADLGILYYDLKEYELAIKTFFNAISISSEKSYLYFYIANSYYKLGKLKKSLDFYEKTIEYFPNHIEALINYSVNLLDIGNTKEALRKIRNAYQINRNSTKVLLIYALTCLKTGIYGDTIEKTDMILEKEPENINAKLIKIQSLINLGKPQEAINILHSFNEEQQNSSIFAFLAYSAYKVLVEETPSNYNENMLNLYFNKINELKETDTNNNEISSYISQALNINKG